MQQINPFQLFQRENNLTSLTRVSWTTSPKLSAGFVFPLGRRRGESCDCDSEKDQHPSHSPVMGWAEVQDASRGLVKPSCLPRAHSWVGELN